jgi:Protein of unknown function (DUF3645)
MSLPTSKGVFKNIRLLQVTPELSETREKIRRTLATELFNQTPREMSWLKEMLCRRSGEFRSMLQSLIVDKKSSAKDMFSTLALYKTHCSYVLALRGLLAYNLLELCLEKRHRVDYGIARTRTKQMAVPFRASDMPSERSEYSHPDVSIILTTLSFYYDGLNDNQLFEAIGLLLSLGDEARNYNYNLWLSSISCNESDLKGIDCSTKLDLSNAMQRDILRLLYSCCMEVNDI